MTWTTIPKTERFQTERIIDNIQGEGPFSRQGHAPFSTDPGNYLDAWTFQDMSIRTWLSLAMIGTGVIGFRVAGSVVNLDPVAMPPASTTFKGYYREANLSVIPWHAGVLP